jgi:glucose-1-phosphate cytidylyltransferase
MIKEYFFNYYRHTSDFKINLATGDFEVLNSDSEDWSITFIDTGLNTQTGGRLKRVREYLDGQTFCLTYGDGVSDIDIAAVIEYHRKSAKLATVSAVQPPGRFATLLFAEDSSVTDFREKAVDEVGWINGGFFVLEPEIFDLIEGDDTVWERGPLETLARTHQLAAYKHFGFWKPMDTLREKRELEEMWQQNIAPWRNLS